MRLYRPLLAAAIVLAFAVIALGAYVRLSDAGLGCPDWPGCYGHWLGVPDEAHELALAREAFPGRPLDTGKAWKEMAHRYLAGSLGLLILAIAVIAWIPVRRRRHSPALPSALLGVVAVQAALGMWTVTLLLKPVIVTLHLVGGMTTLALLVALRLRETQPAAALVAPGLFPLAVTTLVAVFAQIALGGWVSSNYAALACTDFPTCQGTWLPPLDFAHGFAMLRELGQTATGDPLPFAALTAIHWTHRLGALVVTLLVGSLAFALWRTTVWPWRAWSLVLTGALTLQVGLGIANVLLSLPLPLAVAHNLGAALLLAATLTATLRLRAQPARIGQPVAVDRNPGTNFTPPAAPQGSPSAP
ncbi:MAG: heme A synthase [Betaproteobacteria bacterium]|nr:heme A synthase [Betaproteobacteria bacterium]